MAAFYRREREHEVSGSAARARPVSAKEGTRRSVLSAEGCGVLWRAAGALAGGGVVWFRGGQVRGPGVFSSVLPCLTALVGAGEAGDRQRGLHEHGYRLKANGNSEAHSSFDFSGFCLPRVRSNARKNLNFKFLKTATVVRQHIGQGFQNYFCSEEITCFAKICI
jgi:hypothetical protein